MKPYDVSLAVTVAVIWGLAFLASRIALDEFSPALMTALRFAVAAVPCLFVRRPDVSWPLLVAISGTLFLGQFLAQAYGIAHGVPVGLTSVIVQSQALFTVAFAVVVFREIPTRWQSAGIGVAAIGLLMICGTVGFDFSAGAFAVLMISPVSFAIGNLLLRQARDVPMFDLFAWLCLVPPLDFDQHRLLAVGPVAAGLPRGAGGAVRAAGAVRRRRGVEHCFRRAVRAAAACRDDRCGVRDRHHAAVEAAASPAEDRLSASHVAAAFHRLCHVRPRSS
jgi:O-acetylserine/cysteine efflux transporter